MKKIVMTHKDTRGYHRVPDDSCTYSIEYIELCHAYWASKSFTGASRLWANYAYRLRAGLQFTNDLSTWSAFERIKERQELYEESLFMAPRLVKNASDIL